MARKRRTPSPSPSPPPSPPQQSSSGEESGSDASSSAEGSPRAGATPMPPQNPQPHPSAADDAEEESDQDSDALASDADEEDDGGSVESDPEVPEPKKAETATQVKKGSAPGPSGKAKTAAQGKKRPAPDPGPSSKSKKVKAESGKVAPEATPTGKSKKAKAEAGKVAAEAAPTGKYKMAKNPGGKLEESGAPRHHRNWSKHDNILILETLAGHMKKAEQMDAGDLRAAIGHRLDRKNCSKSELYEKIRSLNRRYNNIVAKGNVPTGEDELQMYQLSDAIWGQGAKETIAAAAAAASQKDFSVTKSKNGQASKEKVDGNTKGGTVEEVVNYNIDTQNGKEGTSAVTQNGDALPNGKGKTVDKEALTGNQNGGTGTEEETQEDAAEREANVQGAHKSIEDMQKLYPQLAGRVERIKAHHLTGESLMMASAFISDERVQALESAIIEQKKADSETLVDRWTIQAELINLLVPLMGDT